MSDGTPHRSGIIDAPFEWLTNFRSLRHLVLPSRVAFGRDPSSSSSSSSSRRTASLYGHRSTGMTSSLSLNALHRTGDGVLLRYENVINVDNDARALDGMRRRWEGMRPHRITEGRDGADDSDMNGGCSGNNNMEWIYLDFNSDEACRLAMDGVYRRLHAAKRGGSTSSCDGDESGGCFDLVFDKSTLDCLLCAETSVVARFLCEVYRALRVPHNIPPTSNCNNRDIDTSSEFSPRGGVYVLVSFHPAEFVKNLLMRLPGADWHVEHEVIRREVEDVTHMHGEVDVVVDEVDHDPSYYNAPTEQVVTATKDSAVLLPASNLLDCEEVRMHIEGTCDEWYQATNPMVTSEREEQLRAAFACVPVSKMNTAGDDRGGEYDAELSCDGVALDLKTCYEIIFTEAEKEHLAYEHFVEDWCAYCRRADRDGPIYHDGMTVSIALDFLREMQ
ncbi:hypothetical protein ACHAXA_005810 [Cyclostephanos tholiformis]|uniref:Uncharacterized protein n=1 Tax=Cyclostephanos tholiformis TaxID=382380 RepID=A0ABD3RA33_9STRA